MHCPTSFHHPDLLYINAFTYYVDLTSSSLIEIKIMVYSEKNDKIQSIEHEFLTLKHNIKTFFQIMFFCKRKHAIHDT